MLAYTDLKVGKKFILDGEPCIVLEYAFKKKQRQKPTVQTKIKNLITGNIVERSFGQSDNIKEADIEIRDIRFLYSNRGEFWFCEPDNPGSRFKLDENLIGRSEKFLKENSIIKAQVFLAPNDVGGEGKIIGIELPVKTDLIVTEAMPAVKGDTAQGATKQIKLETGATLNVPIFINQGDVIRVNTEKEEYTERVSKK